MLLLHVILEKLLFLQTQDIQLYIQALKQVSTAVQRANEPWARQDGKERLMTPRSNPRSYTPIHFMTAAKNII